MAVRMAVESWDPEFGSSFAPAEPDPTDADVDTDVELCRAEWKPLTPPSGFLPAGRVAFVDGVRRVDALVWITPEDGVTRMGICASYAAGTVLAESLATMRGIEVRRGLFSGVPVGTLVTRAGEYEPVAVAGDTAQQLSQGVQHRLGDLEASVASSLSTDADLLVLDGPLSGKEKPTGAVGYIKSHRVRYLSEALQRIVLDLEPGQRTPLFLTTTSWSRYSCYLRLPGPVVHPWGGVVRLEISADTPISHATRLAHVSALTLPRYASVPYKDPRAPQNLFPIGGLERELRRRLGDAFLVHRALRAAAAQVR